MRRAACRATPFVLALLGLVTACGEEPAPAEPAHNGKTLSEWVELVHDGDILDRGFAMSAMKTIAQGHEEAVLCLADVYALQRLRFLADKSRHAPLLIMQAETRIRSLADRAVTPLVRLLTTEGIRPELRARTLEPPEEPKAASTALDDAFLLREQRVSAALLLGKLLEKSKLYAVPEAGMPELVRGLERALSDPSPEVRATSAGVLGRTGAKGRSALPSLRQAARDPAEDVAKAAAAAIAAIEEAGSS